ncbi:MAG: nuclear transport factor 2 family protein [Chloroflexi bacterium]|nr:nuclear transport factor 2 family protein [Chloroflexota bacterium]
MPSPLSDMARFAPACREVAFLEDFFARLRKAEKNGDFSLVRALVADDAILRTSGAVEPGADAVMAFLQVMAKNRWRIAIVGPKGGLISVLVSPLANDGSIGQSHEQVYHINHDKLVELIAIGRTPDMVYRPRSQPN